MKCIGWGKWIGSGREMLVEIRREYLRQLAAHELGFDLFGSVCGGTRGDCCLWSGVSHPCSWEQLVLGSKVA